MARSTHKRKNEEGHLCEQASKDEAEGSLLH